jgi:hypothetical protein
MPVTREYLEEQLASLKTQAEQALVTIHNANGAMSAIQHLLSMLDAEASAQPVAVEDSTTEAQP